MPHGDWMAPSHLIFQFVYKITIMSIDQLIVTHYNSLNAKMKFNFWATITLCLLGVISILLMLYSANKDDGTQQKVDILNNEINTLKNTNKNLLTIVDQSNQNIERRNYHDSLNNAAIAENNSSINELNQSFIKINKKYEKSALHLDTDDGILNYLSTEYQRTKGTVKGGN